MKMGKLIVIEGTDGSGQSTQFRLLTQRLQDEGREFRQLVFPQYAEPSSALIRMYLAGEFGTNPSDVNAYAASTFFAVDRYASYKKVWGQWYERVDSWSPTVIPLPMPSIRLPRNLSISRRSSLPGSMPWSMTIWACPDLTW